jgi:probable rRNA maturation factor
MDEEPDYDISVNADYGSDESADPLLRSVIEAALRRHAVVRAEIEVTIVSDARIAELNARFLGHEGPTDVLTFDLAGERQTDASTLDGHRADAAEGNGPSHIDRIEGQIVVSLETAMREAAERGHSVTAELALYIVHGVLHLLGFDDHTEAESDRMHDMEDELLTVVGIGPVYKAIEE